MTVRLRVKEVAIEKGIGMGKLQRSADVAYNTVKRMFKDPYYITTTETLGKIARALGVPPGELLKRCQTMFAVNLFQDLCGQVERCSRLVNRPSLPEGVVLCPTPWAPTTIGGGSVHWKLPISVAEEYRNQP